MSLLVLMVIVISGLILSFKNLDGTLKPVNFYYSDKAGINAHFKSEFAKGAVFSDLQKIVDQGFATQSEIDTIQVDLDVNEKEADEKFEHAIFLSSIEKSMHEKKLFEARFDSSGIISDGGFGLKVSYDDINKSFTCDIPSYAWELIPVVDNKPNYFLEIENQPVDGFKWDSVKNIENFEIFQINSLGERHELNEEIRLKAYFHEPLTVI